MYKHVLNTTRNTEMNNNIDLRNMMKWKLIRRVAFGVKRGKSKERLEKDGKKKKYRALMFAIQS